MTAPTSMSPEEIGGLIEELRGRTVLIDDGYRDAPDALCITAADALTDLSRQLAEARAAYDQLLTTWAECRQLLSESRAEVERVTRGRDGIKAESIARGRLLIKMRDVLININDTLDDEGDRVYFGSTNHADYFKEVVQNLDAFKWDLIMAEKDQPNLLEKCRAANLRADAAERERDEAKRELNYWESEAGLLATLLKECDSQRQAAERDRDHYKALAEGERDRISGFFHMEDTKAYIRSLPAPTLPEET
jgi:hypothetical protein